MTAPPYDLIPETDLPPALGLIVLQADETLERENHKGPALDRVADRQTCHLKQWGVCLTHEILRKTMKKQAFAPLSRVLGCDL